jgi:Na+-transporting NADH:ubiquinone oxidoreductase subunit A
MTQVIKIKKGLDIKLNGEADKILVEKQSDSYAVKPTDFIGVFPKLLIKEGDTVKAGQPIFFNKYNEKIIFTAPVSGKISEIKRGAKRLLLEIIIESDSEIKYVDHGKEDLNGLDRSKIIEKMLSSGVWPVLRQRPYSVIANPDDTPRSIFISGFDTAPLSPDFDFIVHGQGDLFQAGLDILSKLTEGRVHLNLKGEMKGSKVFSNSKKVSINYFEGPHPAGNVGVQIHHLDPINKGDIIWYLGPQEVITIGKLFLEGKYDATKIIALTGSEVLKPRYYKVISGISIKELISDNLNEGDLRYISGNVLTGTRIDRAGYLGFYANQITVIPEGKYFEFIGWALPGFGKFSFSKTFCSWLTPSKKYSLDTNMHGGVRAVVMNGYFEKVFPFNIYPVQLIKAILVKDIDLMENLGIYEIDDEDFALCEVIDTSKMEIQSIVREGLDFLRNELS